MNSFGCLLHVPNCVPWKSPSTPPRRCKIKDVKVSLSLGSSFKCATFRRRRRHVGGLPFVDPHSPPPQIQSALRSLSAPQRPLRYAKTSVIYFIGACVPAAQMASAVWSSPDAALQQSKKSPPHVLDNDRYTHARSRPTHAILGTHISD